MAVSAGSTMASPLRALMNTTSYDGVKHPYYPLDANIVGYVANESTVLSLLGSFVAGCVAIFGLTYLAVKKVNPRLPATELMTVMWFVLCGCIHLFFEGEYDDVLEARRIKTETVDRLFCV
jgi:cholestenol delta-isomerase